MPCLAYNSGVSGGRLIVIEGLDGAGTTTQARRVCEHFGATAHLTREPSDGPIGRLIREMLTGYHAIAVAFGGEAGHSGSISQGTFGLLFAADRLDHMQREVEPQIAAGVTVVSDRWYHSSLAYQGTGADRDWIATLNARARRPDLTVFLKVRPEIAAQRRVAAGRPQELFETQKTQQAVYAGHKATISQLQATREPIESVARQPPGDTAFAFVL